MRIAASIAQINNYESQQSLRQSVRYVGIELLGQLKNIILLLGRGQIWNFLGWLPLEIFTLEHFVMIEAFCDDQQSNQVN